MAAPTGNGTEILKGYGTVQTNGTWSIGCTASGASINLGVDHIATILTISGVNRSNSSQEFAISVHDGSSNIHLWENASQATIGAREVFVWNDRTVIPSGSKLQIWNGNYTFDWYVSLIDQDWSGSN